MYLCIDRIELKNLQKKSLIQTGRQAKQLNSSWILIVFYTDAQNVQKYSVEMYWLRCGLYIYMISRRLKFNVFASFDYERCQRLDTSHINTWIHSERTVCRILRQYSVFVVVKIFFVDLLFFIVVIDSLRLLWITNYPLMYGIESEQQSNTFLDCLFVCLMRW